MTLSGPAMAFVAAQLLLAGLTFGIGVEQAVMWWRTGRDPTGKWLTAGALALSIALVANVGVLRASPGAVLEGSQLVRAAALSAQILIAVVFASTLARRRPPGWLIGFLGAVIVVRLMLWVGTDALYAHRVEDGGPVYGPLLPAVNGLMIVTGLAYVCLAAVRYRLASEQVILAIGVVGSGAVAAARLAVSDPVPTEILTGFLMVPALVAIFVIGIGRTTGLGRTARHLVAREAALADLAHAAVSQPLAAVTQTAEQVVREYTGASMPGASRRSGSATVPSTRELTDRAFLDVVTDLVASARERKRSGEETAWQSSHDDLTGLMTKAMLHDWLVDAIARAAPDGSGLTTMLVGLDRVTAVNMRFGRAVGDRVLVATADRLRGAALPRAAVCRLDGDVFAVAYESRSDEWTGADEAARVRAAVAKPIVVEDGTVQVSCSIGIATCDATSSADDVVRRADAALQLAKEGGGNRIEAVDPDAGALVRHRVALRDDLARAVSRREIVVHYQPIVELATGRVVGAEALARWRRGDTLLPPMEWIPLAEETGAIEVIGAHVLTEACTQLRQWAGNRAEACIKVNVSPRQLCGGALLGHLQRLITAGLKPECLCIEITEGLGIEDDAAVDILHEIRELGVRLALDDFGVGHSSLDALTRLPVDTVKIDGAFVSRVEGTEGAAIAVAILELAERLHLDVIAEKIERPGQLAVLIDLGCRYGQGFLLGQPGPATALSRT